MLKYSFLLLTLFLVSCNGIETGDSLSSKDFQRFRSLHLIENGERLYKFYSEFKKSVAGNFYTDRRMASYWIDGSKEEIAEFFNGAISKWKSHDNNT